MRRRDDGTYGLADPTFGLWLRCGGPGGRILHRAGPPRTARRLLISFVLQAARAASLAACIALQGTSLHPGLTVAATPALAGAVVGLLPRPERLGAESLPPPLPQ
ncbi:MAG: hypothetical protein MUE73_21450 [Planctomycetes bacterium]|nr:hypothetical protein [Planctomycetota bacterium]